jgi:sucrose-phosphate synthase
MTGVARHYTWEAHAERYLESTAKLGEKFRPVAELAEPVNVGRYRNRALFTDLDLSLVGNAEALAEFRKLIEANHRTLVFGIATGRRLDSALTCIRDNGIPTPDVLITSLGTRIHYGTGLTEDSYWAEHIDVNWSSDRVRRALAGIDGLTPQRKAEQSRFKVSYFHDQQIAPSVEEIVDLLRQKEATATVVHSFGQYVDVIPARASKGQALRYVADRLELPLERILVAGGSGADEDMMRGIPRAVVVSNRHGEELSDLTGPDGIYFAESPFAAGILEAIAHYDFLAT